MPEKIKISISGLTTSESELNQLLKETLDGIRDDINEAQENCDVYLQEMINKEGGKENYGALYNDALKIKGAVRDKQLKYLNMFKDRVGKKEDREDKVTGNKGTDGQSFNHADLNKYIEEFSKGGNIEETDDETDEENEQ